MAKKFDRSVFIGRFKEETNEHLSRLEKEIIFLEKNPQDEKLLEEMMRQAHTLKGSATMMGYKRIAELAHKFEDVILQIKKGEVEPRDSHFEFLFEVLDTIRPLLEDKVTREGPEPVSVIREPAQSIRVDVNKLNQLLNLVGELVVGKIWIEQRKKDLGNLLERGAPRELKKDLDSFQEEFGRTIEDVGLVISELEHSVLGVRMTPLEAIFQTLPRAVRDLAREQKKLVDFNVVGEETELDKTVLEKIQDPLTHLLRNAVGHGIEPPQERKKSGKPEAGRIDLRAYYKGSQVIIEVEDDGGGIDIGKTKAMAIKNGLLTAEEAKEMPDSQVPYLLFNPGMSTETEVSQLSGRGVGLNVVKTNVSQLKGMIDLTSEPGRGTKFSIKLPLTLAVTQVLFVRAGSEVFAVPLESVEETLRITKEQIKKAEKREAIAVRDEIIPLVRLGEILGIKRQREISENECLAVMIVRLAEKKLAILCDELLEKLEVVAKSLGDHLKKVVYIAGSTILGTGKVVLILDIPALISQADALPGLERAAAAKEERAGVRRSILIVEDSLITRDLEKSILEAAGYRVGLAKDGLEALNKLAGEKFDLVLADIVMPGMDGIEMLRRMKEDERFNQIPVVIVSARESDEDKKKGLQAGASAYFAKSQFDQASLLDAIERLIV